MVWFYHHQTRPTIRLHILLILLISGAFRKTLKANVQDFGWCGAITDISNRVSSTAPPPGLLLHRLDKDNIKIPRRYREGLLIIIMLAFRQYSVDAIPIQTEHPSVNQQPINLSTLNKWTALYEYYIMPGTWWWKAKSQGRKREHRYDCGGSMEDIDCCRA